MCGFAGFFGGNRRQQQSSNLLLEMGKVISHRGPDDEGIFYDANVGLGFVHRRLSITDLSAAGHQPMTSYDDRYVIVFNGEIYNHDHLRNELNGCIDSIGWRGHSDTETLLACFVSWGIEETVKKCIGMFAFAVWDKHFHELTLVRDRAGEKPLYYGWQGQGDSAVFLFGSELKALRVHPRFDGTVDRGALTLYLRHNYIPAPYSIYKNIKKLTPGCSIKISLDKPVPKETSYWSMADSVLNGLKNPYTGTAKEAIDDLEHNLTSAISMQMIADVPLGAFLSGGVDSSLIVALMQNQSSRPVKTFTIGFEEESHNEATYAKAVAQHIGTDHTELYINPQDAMDVVPLLPTLYDEPFSDPSQIPTYLLSKLTRQQVTVSLSGDAGDELFGGYSRYAFTNNMYKKIALAPLPLRRILSKLIYQIPPSQWNDFCSRLPGFSATKSNNIGVKLYKGAQVLQFQRLEQLYLYFMSHWHNPDDVVINGIIPENNFLTLPGDLESLGSIERMMYYDTVSYLPDDILVKVDRAAMGASLETRVPLLDHRIIEFAWQLPLSFKVNNGVNKWILRQVLNRHVPAELIDRPKKGFGVPIDQWLRGGMRDWAEYLLNEKTMSEQGYFNPKFIREKWDSHLAGDRDWQNPLWDVLMFQAWLKNVS